MPGEIPGTSASTNCLNKVTAETPRATEAPRAVAAAVTAPPLPEPVERPGVTIEAPAGWHRNGQKPEMYDRPK